MGLPAQCARSSPTIYDVRAQQTRSGCDGECAVREGVLPAISCNRAIKEVNTDVQGSTTRLVYARTGQYYNCCLGLWQARVKGGATNSKPTILRGHGPYHPASIWCAAQLHAHDKVVSTLVLQ
jgi:hypothetical protein